MEGLLMKQSHKRAYAPRLLITMPWGIGDTIVVGLSAVDQITQNDPAGTVEIDALCNHSQAKLLEHDPRIHRIIQVDTSLFPTAEAGSWKRGIFLSPVTLKLAQHLRDQHYSAILTFMFAPTFFYRLHTPILFLNLQQIWHVISAMRTFGEVSMQKVIRQSINNYFGRKSPEPSVDEPIPLYICPEHVQKAIELVASIKGQVSAPSKLLLVAPDTSSVITRPPTSLLAGGIAGALKRNQDLLVAILPSFTDTQASMNLLHTLSPGFPGRIVLMPAEPQLSLLELTAFIDQSDLFVTGDTGVMHLAAAMKKIENAVREELTPRNAVKIIALFGGTHPGLHGYSKRTLILGKGRKEQVAFAPGVAKDLYNPHSKNFFDHISPQQLTDAIMSQL
jgi:ADP-heptose:LPS heptosyltransferase